MNSEECKHKEWNDTAIPGGKYCLSCKLIRAKNPLQGDKLKCGCRINSETDHCFIHNKGHAYCHSQGVSEESWEETWNEELKDLLNDHWNEGTDSRWIYDFMRRLLSHQRQELKEEIIRMVEGNSRKIRTFGKITKTHIEDLGHNRAISDILEELRK